MVTPGPDVDDDPRTFVSEDDREQALRIGARAGEFVGVTDAAGLDLDQHLAGLRPLEIDRHDFQRLARGISNGSFRFHATLISTARAGLQNPSVASARVYPLLDRN